MLFVTLKIFIHILTSFTLCSSWTDFNITCYEDYQIILSIHKFKHKFYCFTLIQWHSNFAEVLCGNPMTRENEVFTTTGFAYNDTAQHACTIGYSYDPHNVNDRIQNSTCQPDGEWSTLTRNCTSKLLNVMMWSQIFWTCSIIFFI